MNKLSILMKSTPGYPGVVNSLQPPKALSQRIESKLNFNYKEYFMLSDHFGFWTLNTACEKQNKGPSIVS